MCIRDRGYIGCKLFANRDLMTLRRTLALGRSVASAYNRTAVGRGTSRQGVVELEIDIIKEITISFASTTTN